MSFQSFKMYTQITPYSGKTRLINMLASYGIKAPVLSAFQKIPRELFLPKEFRHSAYEDRAISIGEGQTNSQPSLTAMTLQELNLQPHKKVLEIGTGSGFQTALLSTLVNKVYSIEINKSLGKFAKNNLKKIGIKNVSISISDGTLGINKYAPYDIIIINAAFAKVPKPLIDQLIDNGHLAMPVGSQDIQELIIYKKVEGELVKLRSIAKVKFVPLLGKYGLNSSKS